VTLTSVEVVSGERSGGDPTGERLSGSLTRLQQPGPAAATHISLSSELKEYLKRVASRVGTVNSFSTTGGRLRTPIDAVYVALPVNRVLSVRVENENVVDVWIEQDDGESDDARRDHEGADPDLGSRAAPPWLEERAKDAVGQRTALGALPALKKPLISAPPWYPGIKKGFLRLDAADAIGLARHAVITGPPGSGKSSVTRFVSFSLCQWLLGRPLSPTVETFGSAWRDQPPRHVPVYIELRRLFTRGSCKEPDVEATVQQVWEFLGEELSLESDLTRIRRELVDLPTVWILDGVDEIPLPLEPNGLQDRKRQVRELVESIASEFDQATILLTCRDYAISSWDLDDIEQFTLASMRSEDAQCLLQRLCERRETPEDRLPSEVKRVLEAVQSVPATLRDYPLFLSLMAAIYWDDEQGGLPHTRALLYERSIQLLLERWSVSDDDERSLMEQLNCSPDDLVERLEVIAYETHARSLAETHETPDIDFATLLVQLFRMGNTVDAHRVLAYLSEHSGVLVAREPEVFAFAHRGFQEFLAGARFKREAEDLLQRGAAEAFPRAADLLASDPLLWREPLLLLAESIVEGERPGDVWILVAELLEAAERHADDGEWWIRWLVARVFDQQGLIDRQTVRDRHLVPLVGESSLRLLRSGALSASERRDAAMTLGIIGDPRPGVGVDQDGTPELLLVPVDGGRVSIGTTDDDVERLDPAISQGWTYRRETPACTVDLSEYAIAAVPVTVAQFEAFLRAPDGYGLHDWWTEEALQWRDSAPDRPVASFRMLPNYPAVNVSWYEAVAFCAWSSARTGREIRLPTEPEWEHAARPDGRHFSWGDRSDEELGNSKLSGFAQPVPVDCYSGVGAVQRPIKDLCGNIWEWCSTAATDAEGHEFSYPYVTEDNREKIELGHNAYRVVRGGSFVNPPFLLRGAYRGRDRPSERASRIGFRVASSEVP